MIGYLILYVLGIYTGLAWMFLILFCDFREDN
jgi:hypothetical protein